LAYRSERFEESARRTAFLATFVLGSLLALAAAWRTLGRGVLALLLLSTVVPIALGGAPSIAFLSAQWPPASWPSCRWPSLLRSSGMASAGGVPVARR
jgi:hypothetical protein